VLKNKDVKREGR